MMLQGLAGERRCAIFPGMSENDTKVATAASPVPPGPKDGATDPNAESALQQGGNPGQKPGEIGGPRGPEPTRYGDWESKGRCTDF